MDCGPTCLRMVAKYYRLDLSAQEIREAAEKCKDGVNMLGIAQAAEKVGFKTLGVKVNLEKQKKKHCYLALFTGVKIILWLSIKFQKAMSL